MQLEAEEKPTYDNVFIHLGPFYITCTFFSMLGKYLAEQGGPHILNETHVIEKRSLKSFLSGKSYSRCKRSHQLLGAAMEILKQLSAMNFTQYIEKKTFTNILQAKKLMRYLSSKNIIQRKHQNECMEKQPNSVLGILKCYTCIMSLFKAFDQETWNYTFTVSSDELITFSFLIIQIMLDDWYDVMITS